MNAKPLIGVVAALALQACYYRLPGDVTFTWTFVGDTCAAANVDSVYIYIPGETLPNGGVFSCLDPAGDPEVTLTRFRGGRYTYTIDGLDSSGYTTHVGSGSFTIDGDIIESVDLTPVGQPTSFAWMTWSFPGNVLCADAEPQHQGLGLGGVRYLDVSLDAAAATRLDCFDGSVADGSTGIATPLMDPGTHTIDISAVSSSSFEMFRYSGSFVTQASHAISNQMDLQWAVGGAVVSWTLANGGTTESCATAGQPTVLVQFAETLLGGVVYPPPGDPVPCSAAPARYFYLPASAAGTSYELDMTAEKGATTWFSITSTPPVIVVQPGVFPLDSTATNLILRRN